MFFQFRFSILDKSDPKRRELVRNSNGKPELDDGSNWERTAKTIAATAYTLGKDVANTIIVVERKKVDSSWEEHMVYYAGKTIDVDDLPEEFCSILTQKAV